MPIKKITTYIDINKLILIIYFSLSSAFLFLLILVDRIIYLDWFKYLLVIYTAMILCSGFLLKRKIISIRSYAVGHRELKSER